MSQLLTIALPKGKLGATALELMQLVGLPYAGVATEARQLAYDFAADNLRYIICRPTDIPTYVEYGAADLGVVGKDTLAEAGKDVFELVDLRFGLCRLVVAVPARWAERFPSCEEALNNLNLRRVASKYPRVAADYFRQLGLQVEVIKLHGNIELAPQTGLAEGIVDLVSTGKTLEENQLVPLMEVLQASARLVANRVSYRLQPRCQQLVELMRQAVAQRSESKCS